MPFSAATCITYTGFDDNLGPILYLYSNNDTTPFGSVNTVDIIEPNCPYIITNIPNETYQIVFQDPQSLCCGAISINNSNSCEFCNLQFDVYETDSVGQLLVGNLISECNTITDYIINWYRVGEEEIVFRTGIGTEFADLGWDLTHPLIGVQSPLVEAGSYYPVIDRVLINGVVFTNDAEPGTVQSNLDCFRDDIITVRAITCEQGNNVGDYKHFYQFSNYSVGSEPIGLSTDFLLSPTTNYIPWSFRGDTVYDNLKMVFYGSAYNNIPITIENVNIGADVENPTVSPTTYLKSIASQYFVKKVICLTAFTINQGDYIKISITPNPTINNTIWDLYFTCLDTFDCSNCLDNYVNTAPKIFSQSLEVNDYTCNVNQTSFDIQICDFEEWVDTDTGKYLYSGNYLNTKYNGGSPFYTGDLYWENVICSGEDVFPANINLCGPVGGTYSFNYSQNSQGQGVILFNFQNFDDLSFYMTSYNQMITSISNGAVNNNTNINFFRMFTLVVPVPLSPNEPCGDTTPSQSFFIHYTAQVTTGGTGPYNMQIILPSITNGTNFDNCDLYCDSGCEYIVTMVNFTVNDQGYQNFTTNTGSKFLNPFRNGYKISSLNSQRSNVIQSTFMSQWSYERETYPFSGVNNTFIPNLSGLTCPYKGRFTQTWFGQNTGTGYFQEIADYSVYLTNSEEVTDITVKVRPNTSFLLDPVVTAITYSNGQITYTNPLYVI